MLDISSKLDSLSNTILVSNVSKFEDLWSVCSASVSIVRSSNDQCIYCWNHSLLQGDRDAWAQIYVREKDFYADDFWHFKIL